MEKNEIIEILQVSLATEIICVLRYRNHYYVASGSDSLPVADEFLKHSDDEFQHMNQLAQRIIELDGKPNMNPSEIHKISHVDYVPGSNLIAMIKDNLSAELIAVAAYTDAIQKIGGSDP